MTFLSDMAYNLRINRIREEEKTESGICGRTGGKRKKPNNGSRGRFRKSAFVFHLPKRKTGFVLLSQKGCTGPVVFFLTEPLPHNCPCGGPVRPRAQPHIRECNGRSPHNRPQCPIISAGPSPLRSQIPPWRGESSRRIPPMRGRHSSGCPSPGCRHTDRYRPSYPPAQ